MPLPLPAISGREYDFVRPTTSRKAVAGLIFGLLSFLFGVFASVPAFLYAARALGEIDRDRAHVKGRGLAIAGIFAAGLGLFLQPMLLLFGVQVARDRVMRATDAANLRRIGEAMYAYNDEHNHLPPAASQDANGQPLLSWRVALLPYLGEKELYERFHRDEPWDSPHNFALIERMPQVYAHPADPEAVATGATHYRVFVGGEAPFTAENGPKLPSGPNLPGSFPGGVSGTLLVVGAADPVPWTKPDELIYDDRQPVPRLGGLLSAGCNVLLADGTVRFMRDDVDERTWRRAIDGALPSRDW